MNSAKKKEGDRTTRMDAIRRLLRAERIGTQEELRERLMALGFDVTQATLSRDLARLGAVRKSLPDGGSVYELGALPTPDGNVAHLGGLVTDVVESVALVVVATTPGAASAVALALDRGRLEEVAGTIAGDDTIFVAPTQGSSPRRVARRLRRLWRKGEVRA